MPAVAVPVFAVCWWLGAYLIGRDPTRAVLLRAAAALLAYAAGVVAWTMAPESAVTAVLLCAPALLWAGVTAALLPAESAERRPVNVGWLLAGPVFLLLTVLLPAAGKLIALAPLAGGLVLLLRHRHQVRPPLLPVALTGASILYALALATFLTRAGDESAVLLVATIGLDQLLLGFLVAVADAAAAGERLLPDLRRSLIAAVAAVLLVAGPVALTLLATPYQAIVTILQFLLVAVVMSGAGAAGLVRTGFDRLAFLSADRLRRDRESLFLAADSLPRRGERHGLATVDEAEFHRLVRRALRDYGDTGRLLRNPLVDLPVVERRLHARGPGAAGQPLARVTELRAVLGEEVARLQPGGAPATTGEWRHYNTVFYCQVRGLRPYERGPVPDNLDRDARRVLDWFRRYVPRPMVRRWSAEGAAIVAGRLWKELT
ncbi:hypothetical protein [Symbioplanes lichenis]|uniref:hypothetical protein n=1 Tax=Symbioplanes lichenis TaxID=1629072 RepID=UPI002738AA74|nr:hypothetical protein [Actinoplanes lichenis]